MRYDFPLFVLLFICFTQISVAQTIGLIGFDEDSEEGYTLLVPLSYNQTYLIDNCGRVVNKWISDYTPGMTAYLRHDGALVRATKYKPVFGNGGEGGRFEIYDWDGNLEWSYIFSSDLGVAHHDFEVLPNGNLLIIMLDGKTADDVIALGRDPELIEPGSLFLGEKIMEIKPVGSSQIEIIWEWSVWDHITQDFDASLSNYSPVSNAPNKIDINYPNKKDNDWLHINSIDYHPERDEVLINSRNFGEFWIIDHANESGNILYRYGNPEAYKQGDENDRQLFGQHNANWVEEGRFGEGNIMVFNNSIDNFQSQRSQVIELSIPLDSDGAYQLQDTLFEPATTVWQYPSAPSESFYSARISGAQRLTNGNTLMVEGRKGELSEVTQEEQLVWNYINPVNNAGPAIQGSEINNNDHFNITRYPYDFVGFENKDMSPGAPIELEPLTSDCITTNKEEELVHEVEVFPVPFHNELSIYNPNNASLNVAIYDMLGNRLSIEQDKLHSNSNLKLNLQVDAGIYIVKIFDNNMVLQSTKTTIKI